MRSLSASGCPSGSSSHPWRCWLWPWPPPPCRWTQRRWVDPRGTEQRLIGSGPARCRSGTPAEHSKRDVTQTHQEGAKSMRSRPRTDSTTPDTPVSAPSAKPAHAASPRSLSSNRINAAKREIMLAILWTERTQRRRNIVPHSIRGQW